MLDKLKAALGRHPWDQELRLVYADSLEENGQLEAAQEQRRAASKKQRRPAKGPAQERRLTSDTTDGSAIYRRLHKWRLIDCGFCSYHGPCNGGRRPAHTSWKKSRKQRWRMK